MYDQRAKLNFQTVSWFFFLSSNSLKISTGLQKYAMFIKMAAREII